MKYCIKCGAPLEDDDKFCQKCGAPVEEDESAAKHAPVADAQPKPQPQPQPKPQSQPQPVSGMKSAAKIFMILGCIVTGFALIPLAWTIPMTLSYSNKINTHQPVGLLFKICTFLFVNAIAGLLMICDSSPD